MPAGRDRLRAPYFFLSYAHARGMNQAERLRRDKLVRRFYEDLGLRVREIAADSLPTVGASDMDLKLGARWSEWITECLAHCRSFVALYSDDYFTNENCGREWHAFSGRLDNDHVLLGRRPEAIVPVLWQPVSDGVMPRSAGSVQYTEFELGTLYRRRGLHYLLRHEAECRAEYEATVTRLAERVVEIAEQDPPTALSHLPDFLTLANAFAPHGDPDLPRARIRIVIAAPSHPALPRGAEPEMYGERPTHWRPYLPGFDEEIARMAARLAESMNFQPVLESLEQSVEIKAGVAPSAPTLLIIDPWAAQVPALQQRLSRFDGGSHLKLWIRPVVAWNREHPANKPHEAELESRLFSTLTQCRSRYRPEFPMLLDGLGSAQDFIAELPDVIRRAERRYLTEIARERAEDLDFAAPRRPRFGEPAGARAAAEVYAGPRRGDQEEHR